MTNLALKFYEWAGSSRGLQSRPMLADNTPLYQSGVDSISYDVYNVTDNLGPVTGTLDPNEVMFAALQEWEKDDEGCSFIWQAPGTLWPLANKTYRIVVTFLTTTDHGSVEIIHVWEVITRNPEGE